MTDLPSDSPTSATQNSPYSLRELVDLITGKTVDSLLPAGESGVASVIPYPFMGIVGQQEMKIALLLALVNPLIGGVLLIGPRGTGKTTAVRSLVDLMPVHKVSQCYYGCLPEDIETGGMDAVCPDCARKYGEGQPLTRIEQAHLIELPLNSRLEDVIGGWDERELAQNRFRLKRGLLAQADLNLLFVDEVNLLGGEIIDAILDAAAMGTYSIRRGGVSATYKARITLVGSMNPEEGPIRPQIMDRFGLRVFVRGLEADTDRLEAYRRMRIYRNHPYALLNQFAAETETARDEIQRSREALEKVQLPEKLAKQAVNLIHNLRIDSLRAEITLLESARALAAIDGRSVVELSDIKTLAPMALRLRQSPYIEEYFKQREIDDKALQSHIDAAIRDRSDEG